MIDRLYEAAVVPDLWRSVLVDFTRLFGAKDSVLLAARGMTFDRWIVTSPAFEDLVLAHSRRFPTNERTRRLMAVQHAGFVSDYDVFTQDEIDREPVFQELFIPRGYGSGAATVIRVPSGGSFILHTEFTRGHGPIPRPVISGLDGLRPHFARALLLSAQLELQQMNAAAQALSAIGLPAAVLGRRGRLLVANELFHGLMPAVARDRATRVALVDPGADRLLATAVEALDTGAHDAAVRSIPVRAHQDWPPLIVHLVPVKGVAHDFFGSADAILIVTPVVARDVPTANVLEGLFDLTPAEAKLAQLVGASRSPRDAALQLGIGLETARTVLKRVLAKTGTHRQSELVALLTGASAPVAR